MERTKVLTLKKFIKFFGASGDLDDLWPSLVEFCCCGETHGDQFSCFSLKETKPSSESRVHPICFPPLVMNTVMFCFVEKPLYRFLCTLYFTDHLPVGTSEQNWNSAQRQSINIHLCIFWDTSLLTPHTFSSVLSLGNLKHRGLAYSPVRNTVLLNTDWTCTARKELEFNTVLGQILINEN